MPDFLKKLFRYHRHREVLRVCLPLVISLSATTVMEFTDRVFLANYSIEAISAALPAGITSYLFIAFFGGVGGYAGVFIAQYTGRGNPRKIGVVLWQGIYFTLASGAILWLLAVFATKPIFALAGHSEDIRQLEEIYFSILCKGSILHVAMATLATFFTGRGLTRPVMLITFLGVFINIPLDYALIFGRWGMPQLGIEGAAIATVVAWGINVLFLAGLIFSQKNDHRFGVFSSWRFDRDIFIRLMRFGIPGSLQFTMDILAFTLFILLVGRIGTAELAATNIVLSINALAFMPSMGASQGMSVLVGQALGKNNPALAASYVVSGCQLLIAYILVIDLIFIFAPDFVLAPFMASDQGTASQQLVFGYGQTLLKIVAAYLFFDALYMVFSGALRGAGDTRFMMLAIGMVSPFCLILPVYIGIEFFQISITTAWLWVLLFITVLFLLSALRYRHGIWKKMLVIEDESQS
ncbi:MATE family efflux transporter [Desulfocastanea catecholica]